METITTDNTSDAGFFLDNHVIDYGLYTYMPYTPFTAPVTGHYHYHYDNLNPMLVEEIKELRDEVALLRKEIKRLRKGLAED